MELRNIHFEGVALFEDALAPDFNESIELDSEFRHAIAQLVEAEVDGGERVGH